MKNRKAISLLLAGLLTITAGNMAYAADMDAEISEAQEARQAAEAQLSQTQGVIGDMEVKKQELENYLGQLNAKYEELTNSVSELGIKAAEKEEELKKIKENLDKARETSQQQYEAMKIRIAYMYEKGGATALELLLSSKDFAEFLNRAENVIQISEYDRDMLEKYETLQKEISEQEEALEKEAAEIDELMKERVARQQEVQTMAAATSDSIQSYVAQISASQEEAAALMAEVSNANSNIISLMQAREEAEAQAAEAQSPQEETASWESYGEDTASENEEEDYGYNPDEDTAESDSSADSYDTAAEVPDDSEASEPVVETEYQDDTYQESTESEESYEESYEDSYEESYEESSSDSGQGTYLGNFTLTAYCNCAQCCGTAGNLTASGTVPTAGRTVAMAGVPFGTQLLINGNVYTVEDLGTPYGHVDIFFDSHSDALAFGLQYADVYQL